MPGKRRLCPEDAAGSQNIFLALGMTAKKKKTEVRKVETPHTDCDTNYGLWLQKTEGAELWRSLPGGTDAGSLFHDFLKHQARLRGMKSVQRLGNACLHASIKYFDAFLSEDNERNGADRMVIQEITKLAITRAEEEVQAEVSAAEEVGVQQMVPNEPPPLIAELDAKLTSLVAELQSDIAAEDEEIGCDVVVNERKQRKKETKIREFARFKYKTVPYSSMSLSDIRNVCNSNTTAPTSSSSPELPDSVTDGMTKIVFARNVLAYPWIRTTPTGVTCVCCNTKDTLWSKKEMPFAD